MEALNPPSTSGLPSHGQGGIVSLVPFLEAMGIEVLDPYRGHIRCPGEQLHTHPTRSDNCTIFKNDGVFRIHCYHQSCRELVDRVNTVFKENARRDAAEERRLACQPPPPEDSLRELGKPFLNQILEAFPWSYDDIINDPVGRVTEPVEQHYQLLLGLFNEKDIVWIGREVNQTGRECHAYNFRSAKEWMSEKVCPGQYICPSAFLPAVISRKNCNVSHKPFLVVESDDLTKDETGALFRYLMSLEYKLRAIVDTGNKSLHGWFNYPGDEEILRLKPELTALRCDPKPFSPQQPMRLPGAVRADGPGKGNLQRLIYLNRKA